MLVFKNDDVAAKYQSSFKGDPVVHVPAGKNKSGGIKRNLSTYTLAEADRLFAMKGQNLLQLKETAEVKKFDIEESD